MAGPFIPGTRDVIGGETGGAVTDGARSQIAEDGMILVRPDKHIAWRSHRMVDDPAHALHAVLSTILSRDTGLDQELTEETLTTAGL